MTDGSLRAAIEADYETELSRLGSSKAIYALTGGDMDGDAVETALAGHFAAAAERFEAWDVDDEAVTAAAETARETAAAFGEDQPPNPTSVHAALADLDEGPARLGGLLAWALVADRTLAQAVGFFVGDADPQGADRVRPRRADVQALAERVEGRLADPADDPAAAAASRVIEAAYGDYVDTLEGLGVKVKPVC